MLILVSGAVPLPPILAGAGEKRETLAKKPYARAAIAADIFHHITTGIGAFQHYAKETHYNASMGVGVWGCAGLALLGVATLVAPPALTGLGAEGQASKNKKAA